MTNNRVQERHQYVEATLQRTKEWLDDKSVTTILGDERVNSAQWYLDNYYVPNTVSEGSSYIRLKTPREYRNSEAIPILAGFPGDRFIPDGRMVQQSPTRQERAVEALTVFYDDDMRARRRIGTLAAQYSEQNPDIFFVSRYDIVASVVVHRRATRHLGQVAYIMNQPILLFMIPLPEEGKNLTSPTATFHEFVHLDDHLEMPVIPQKDYADFMLETELRAHHINALLEEYGIQGLMKEDEYVAHDYSYGMSIARLFEKTRKKHADANNPFAPTPEVSEELWLKGLIK